MSAEIMRNELASRISNLPDDQVIWVGRYIDSFGSHADTFGAYPLAEKQKLHDLRVALLKGEQSGMDRNFDSKKFLASLHDKYAKN